MQEKGANSQVNVRMPRQSRKLPLPLPPFHKQRGKVRFTWRKVLKRRWRHADEMSHSNVERPERLSAAVESLLHLVAQAMMWLAVMGEACKADLEF